MPFALLKEQRPHLGSGSRRWCRAALGETDRQDDEGGPPQAGSLGVGLLGEGVSQPAPPPTRSSPYSLTAAGGVQVRQEVGRTRRPRI